MAVRNKRWCFTLNNYSDVEETHVSTLLGNQSSVAYGVVGKEVGASGTPHLQGFVVFTHGISFATARRRISVRAHLEVAQASAEAAANYCKKDGDFQEFGTLPQQGRRSDLEAVIEWADEFTRDNKRPPTSPEIAQHYPIQFIKQRRLGLCIRNRAPPPVLVEGEPREWQQNLHDKLLVPCEPSCREVVFVIDREGGKGKSWFIRWFFTKYAARTQILSDGKASDLKHAIELTKDVFLFNIPRGNMEYISYSLLEGLKDRMLFSGKYESMTKILHVTPHVIIFGNEYPDYEKLTPDRYTTIEL